MPDRSGSPHAVRAGFQVLSAGAIDAAGADLVVHGHAHAGSEKGATPGGVVVRNVAQPVIHSAYRVYCFNGPAEIACAERPAHRA